VTTSLWHIYPMERSPAEWIGIVEESDADAAIAAAAELIKANSNN
jgi:hypothetical protein